MKKIYWIIIIGSVIILSFIVFQISKGNKPTEVFTEKAIIKDIVEIVSATGKIQPETELKISSDVSGEITEMIVKEGDQVKKGDLLCRIKPDIYVSAFERVNASVNTTKANLKTAEAQLDQAKANLANSEAIYKRNKKLINRCFLHNIYYQFKYDNIDKKIFIPVPDDILSCLKKLKSSKDYNINKIPNKLLNINKKDKIIKKNNELQNIIFLFK